MAFVLFLNYFLFIFPMAFKNQNLKRDSRDSKRQQRLPVTGMLCAMGEGWLHNVVENPVS